MTEAEARASMTHEVRIDPETGQAVVDVTIGDTAYPRAAAGKLTRKRTLHQIITAGRAWAIDRWMDTRKGLTA